MRISTGQITSAGVRQMLLRQADVQQTQLQLATQLRVLKPSDDPVAATSISFLNSEIALLDQYVKNGQTAKGNIELEEGVLSSTTNILFRVQELSVALGNGTYSSDEYNAIRDELEQRLDELIGLGNTKNSNGDYLFSGNIVKTKPFVQDGTGTVTYNGDQGQRFLTIGSSVTVAISDSGFETFVDVKNGNGKFISSASGANTGSGSITSGTYQGPPTFLAEPYDISFGLNFS